MRFFVGGSTVGSLLPDFFFNATVPITFIVGLTVASSGIAAPPIPGTVQPGQIEREFAEPPQPKATGKPIFVPPPTAQPPADADTVRFNLTSLSLSDSTVYTDSDLQSEFQQLLGKDVTLQQVYALADRLTARYRNDGYILSRVIVPPQRIQNGTVVLQTVEGFVDTVNIQGEIKGSRSLLDAYADQIRASRPLHSDQLERYLLLMNDLEGVVATATLAPSETVTGASTLNVSLAHATIDGSLAFSNRGSRFLGPTQLDAQLGLNSVFGGYEYTNLRAVTTFDDELLFGSLLHEQQIGSNGMKVQFALSATESDPGVIGALAANLETDSLSGGITLSYPTIRTRTRNLYLRGSLTAHDGDTDVLGITISEDRVRALRLGLTYDWVDRARGVNIADFEVSQGLDAFGANEGMGTSRPSAPADFTKLNLYAARLQGLWSQWSMLFAVSGQYSFDDLLSPEDFSVGGEVFGRAYDASELVGDSGAAAKVEFRYTGSPAGEFLRAYTAYGFYDFGFVSLRNPLAGEDKQTSLASAGAGVRFNFPRNLAGYVEVSKPLTREVFAESDDDVRVFGGLSVSF